MGNILWTDALVNGDNETQTHITNMKSDISGVINGNITNANIAAAAVIAESKVAFSTTAGHTHNGTDAMYALIKHFRRGCQVQYASATTVTVLPGVLDIAGALLVKATATTLTITTDFLGGESEPADGPVYVYAYNNSGAIGYKFSTSTPELSDSDGLTAEFPLRYHLASAVYYRLVGIIHNRVDISADMCNNFDLCNFACGSFVGDAADEIIYTGWTPHFIWKITCSDSTPANSETILFNDVVQKFGFITANPQPIALLYDMINNTHDTSANGTANSFFNINAQTTAQPGSFSIDAPTTGVVTLWMAWSKSFGSV